MVCSIVGSEPSISAIRPGSRRICHRKYNRRRQTALWFRLPEPIDHPLLAEIRRARRQTAPTAVDASIAITASGAFGKVLRIGHPVYANPQRNCGLSFFMVRSSSVA